MTDQRQVKEGNNMIVTDVDVLVDSIYNELALDPEKLERVRELIMEISAKY